LQDQLIADLSDEELVAMWINDGRNTAEGLRFVWDHGFQHGLAAGRAEKGSTPEPNQAPARLRQCPTHGQQPENAWGCPECVRELREEVARLKGNAPEPNQAPAGDGRLVWEIWDLLEHNGSSAARDVVRMVTEWLRSRGNHYAATELEREAQR
jgi:hypothetical protein